MSEPMMTVDSGHTAWLLVAMALVQRAQPSS